MWQRLHGRSPTVFRHAGFVNPQVVDALVAIGDDELDRAAATFRGSGGHADVPAWGYPALDDFTGRVAGELGLSRDPNAVVRFERHHEGEHVAGHVDPDGDGHLPLVATALLCLVAPGSGGETVFPFVDPSLSIRHEAGQLTLWLNHDHLLRADLRSYHAAEVITGGTKVTMTWFIRQRRSGALELIDRMTDTHDWMATT